MRKRNIVLLHLCFWGFKNMLEFIMHQLPYLSKQAPEVFWRNTVAIWLCYGTYFYAHYFWIVPQYLIKNRFAHYSAWTVATSILFVETLSFIWGNYTLASLHPSSSTVSTLVFCCAMHYFGSTSFRLLEHWVKSEKAKRMLEKEVRETELLYLKSQMSPHFLFNTLNNIYGLSINQSPQTAAALGQLKHMMLYVQHFKEGKRIALHEEIKCLQSFIALNLLRYECHVDFEADVQSEAEIEPMIFLPFIENAFKHGDTRESATIRIRMQAIGKQLSFLLENSIDPHKRKDDVGGIGIQNIRQRLDLIYAKKWKMSMADQNGVFQVQLDLLQV